MVPRWVVGSRTQWAHAWLEAEPVRYTAGVGWGSFGVGLGSLPPRHPEC